MGSTGITRIAFLASGTEEAQQALERLQQVHGNCTPDEADVLCALGGDGFMLQSLHRGGVVSASVIERVCSRG